MPILPDLESKKAFQTYTIQYGFETIRAFIPVHNVKLFESAFDPQKLQRLSDIRAFILDHEGEIALTNG